MRDELNLIFHLNNGRKDAFKKVFDAYYKSICLFIQKYIADSDQAEDLAQDVFVSIWEKKVQFTNLQALKGYLYQTARNKSINALEHERVKKGYQSNAKINYTTEDFFIKNFIKLETQRLIFKSLDTLPPRAKEILYLQLEGYKNNEIADKLEISVYTVKNHKATAYKLLKEKLKDLSILIIFISVLLS